MKKEQNLEKEIKWLKIVLAIVVIILISVAIYFSVKDKVQVVDTQETEENIDVSSEEVKYLMGLLLTDNNESELTYLDSIYDDTKVTAINIPNTTKLWLVYNHLKSNLSSVAVNCNNIADYDYQTYTTCINSGIAATKITRIERGTLDSFNIEYKKVFGNNDISPSNFSYGNTYGYYSVTNKDFLIITTDGTRVEKDTYTVSKLKSAKKIENRIEVLEYRATCIKGTNGDECYSGTTLVPAEEDITKYASLYRHAFIMVNGVSYYWYSTEPISR